MKTYLLIYEEDTDYRCGADVSVFLCVDDARSAMRSEWEDLIESWGYNIKEHKDEDECYCEENSAAIRDGIDSVRWRIEEQYVDVRVAVCVEDDMVTAVYANSDVKADVYDLYVSDFADKFEKDEADNRKTELDALVKSPGWHVVW